MYVGWQGDSSDFSLVQQQLDPHLHGKIHRSRFMDWFKNYCQASNEVSNNNSSSSNLSTAGHDTNSSFARLVAPVKWNPLVLAGGQPRENQQLLATQQLQEQQQQVQQPRQQRQESPQVRVPVKRVQQVDDQDVDWNQEMENLIVASGSIQPKSPSHSPNKLNSHRIMTDTISSGMEIGLLLKRFRETAENIARVVIEENALPTGAKTILPVPAHSEDDLFFKYLSVMTGSSSILKYHHCGLAVYAFNQSSGSFAPPLDGAPDKLELMTLSWQGSVFHRICGNELRAARTIHESLSTLSGQQKQFHQCSWSCRVPLQCTVDYLGFRAFVVADLNTNLQSQPLSDQDKAQVKLALVEMGYDDACSVPNEFVIIESVKGSKDCGSHYLHNVLSALPSEISSEGSTTNPSVQQAAMFKLRPEFLRVYGHQFNLRPATTTSDETARVVAHLDQVVIPSFVNSLETNEMVLFDSRGLTRALHEEGINVRSLGKCHELATLKHIKRLFFTEMIARVCKVLLRESIRRIGHESVMTIIQYATSKLGNESPEKSNSVRITDRASLDLVSSDQPSDRRVFAIDPAILRTLSRVQLLHDIRQTVVEFFNLVLGSASSDCKTFWKDQILPLLYAKFGLQVSSTVSMDALFQDEDLLHWPQLFMSLQAHTNGLFSDQIKINFKSSQPFALDHFQSLGIKSKLFARTSQGCEALMMQTDALIHGKRFGDAVVSLKLQVSLQESAPFDERNISLCHLLTCLADLCLQLGIAEQAEKYASLAIEDGPSRHAAIAKAHTMYMRLYHLHGDLHGAQTHFSKATEVIQWHLGRSHPLLYDTLMTMVEIWYECGEVKEALKLLEACASIAKDSFGKTSLIYGDCRRKQGNLFFENQAYDEAMSVLEDAVGVYEKNFEFIEVKTRGNVNRSVDTMTESPGSVQEETQLGEDSPGINLRLQKEFAASCCYLMAVIQSDEENANANTEAAFNSALRAYSLRSQVLPKNHFDLLQSLLQLGGLATTLGDPYRAVGYYRPALALLKQLRDEQSVDQIRAVTTTLLQLHLPSITAEKKSVLEKTKKHFAKWLASMHQLQEAESPDTSENRSTRSSSSTNSQLIGFVVKKLFSMDPIDYFDTLLQQTELEFHEQRVKYSSVMLSRPQGNAAQNTMENLTTTEASSTESAESPQEHKEEQERDKYATVVRTGSFSDTMSSSKNSSLRTSAARASLPTLAASASTSQLPPHDWKSHSVANEFTSAAQLAAVWFLMDSTTADSAAKGGEDVKAKDVN